MWVFFEVSQPWIEVCKIVCKASIAATKYPELQPASWGAINMQKLIKAMKACDNSPTSTLLPHP
ncbi:28923_t:CDS:2 [Dentiscutata erythropus]|uniref:28923_t:CDS:1 n=1 Tax=Dentiscutata erythropus TaxID=1348616 RepID=A0A9N9GL56_9GLOM|nr:28923_t:CDS:2 [Dentiscutata erythropus]